MSHPIRAAAMAALMYLSCGSANVVHAHSTILLGSLDALVENDRQESGLSPPEGGTPFDRLPSWLQDLFGTDPELRRLRADLVALDAFLERDKAERRATARTPEEIAHAEALSGGVPPVFTYAMIAGARNRAQFLVIQVMHAATCGSGGCATLIYMRTVGRWRQVLDEGGITVILERRRARGLPVFTIWNNHYPCSYSWNGVRFQDEPGCPGW